LLPNAAESKHSDICHYRSCANKCIGGTTVAVDNFVRHLQLIADESNVSNIWYYPDRSLVTLNK